MKMMDRMQVRMDESRNKIELIATTLQTFIKDTSREVPEIFHYKVEKDNVDGYKNMRKEKQMPRKLI